jgi:hypothetical protein
VKHIASRALHLTLIVAACVSPLHGEAQALQELRIDPTQFRETLGGQRPSSGPVIHGLMFGRMSAPIRYPRLRLTLPPGTGAMLCMRIRSANGEYEAEVDRPLDEVPQGTYLISLPTRRGSYLTRQQARNVAVSAWRDRTCLSSEGRAMLPASWDADVASDSLFLMVNVSEGSASTILVDRSGRSGERRCERAPIASPLLFNTVCALQPSNDEESSYVLIWRNGFERVPREFRVRRR